MDSVEQRLDELERIISRSGLGPASALPRVISGVVVGNNIVKADTVKADTISEKTSAAGVTIDGMEVKDGTITSLAGDDCIVVRVDKDGDGDYDPYTSTSWDGDSFSTSTGTINWNTVFGVPTSAKAVCIQLQVKDSDADRMPYYMALKAKSTTTTWSLACHSGGSNKWDTVQGWVPVAADGTTYYGIAASGENTCDIVIRVPLYAR